ncbi:MarR family winged helix-turn-helix transcriptional regulator [Micromonospora sp. NPDC049523]|uniref:MarR family winged helix-turn-helix transcriptional regulator n=1 Tax=Micromonospora sp. NPDC049523 TaxID=3155921 RepID=UPI00341DE7C2
MDLKQLFTDLVRLETEMWNAVDQRLRAEFDLPLGRYDLMQVIARTEGCRVYDLAREVSITVGAASKSVDRIEANGLCVRRPHPVDRRSSIIELTPAGESLLAEATATVENELDVRLGSALPKRDLEHLGATIGTLRAAGARADGDVQAQGR